MLVHMGLHFLGQAVMLLDPPWSYGCLSYAEKEFMSIIIAPFVQLFLRFAWGCNFVLRAVT